MRFLIDENLSPRICPLLIANAHHAAHIRDHGMASATDSQVLAETAVDGLVLITADQGRLRPGACAYPHRRALNRTPY